MTEPTASKKFRSDNGTSNGQHADVQNTDESIITSSSTIKEDAKSQPHHTVAIRASLMSEADRALQESNRRHIKPVVDETTLGIELFVGDRTKQFHGLIKSRYADFIVHEIDLDGQIAKLTSFEVPEDEAPESPGAIKLEDLFERKVLMCLSSVNQGLLDYYKIDVTGMDKDMRTSIHMAIKAAYERLESSTVKGDSELPDFKKDHKSNKQDQQTKVVSLKQEESEGNGVVESNTTSQSESEKSKPSADQVTSDSPPEKAPKDVTTSRQDLVGEQSPEKKYIMVRKQNKPNRPKNIWPRNRPDYTHFVLYKENKDTMDAIHNLAVATYSKPGHFNYAGTKDRRAVTTQWVSSWRLDPRRLINAMRRFNRRPYLKVGNFCFRKDPIRLGQLRANKFDIIIRNLVHNSGGVEVIEDAMTYVRDNGFVNYFGLQRFGSRSVYTHEIGIAILQSDWKKAVDLILSYSYDNTLGQSTQTDQNAETPTSEQPPSDFSGGASTDSLSGGANNTNSNKQSNQRSNNAKRWVGGAEQHNACIDLWKSKGDADLVFKKYPNFKMTNEGLVIKSLGKSSESQANYSAAVESLPRNVRSIYVHAYQSLLWNKLATYRLQKFGYKVIPGDLVIPQEANISDSSLDVLLAVDESDTPEVGLDIIADTESVKKVEKAVERKMPVEEVDANLVIATEEDLDKYSIFDVVLPLIGTRTRLPSNAVGRELERLLGEDGLTVENFRAREKAFISYGSYRKIMVRPKNLTWHFRQYSNPHQNLVDTDLELLNKRSDLITTNDNQADEKNREQAINTGSSDEALVVSFELPPSSYATMCLRELMKKPSTDFNNRF